MKVVMFIKPDLQGGEVSAVLMDVLLPCFSQILESVIMQVHVEDPAMWSCDWSQDGGWSGPQLLYMAGLFDEWTSSEVSVK
jgi:hypothetical protein